MSTSSSTNQLPSQEALTKVFQAFVVHYNMQQAKLFIMFFETLLHRSDGLNQSAKVSLKDPHGLLFIKFRELSTMLQYAFGICLAHINGHQADNYGDYLTEQTGLTIQFIAGGDVVSFALVPKTSTFSLLSELGIEEFVPLASSVS